MRRRPEVLGVDLSQLHLQRLVPYATGRSRALPCGVVRRWGDLQFATDRLAPEALAVGVDEAGHFGSRGSSSRTKKTDAAFRISLARRNSRFSRSSCRSRSRSPVVSPARAPPSTSARRTHVRNVSAIIPNFEAIDVIVAHATHARLDARTPSARPARGSLLGTCLVVSSPHPLRSWSLQHPRGGSSCSAATW